MSHTFPVHLQAWLSEEDSLHNNLYGTINIMTEALRYWKFTNCLQAVGQPACPDIGYKPSIVNVASVQGLTPTPGMLMYGASKVTLPITDPLYVTLTLILTMHQGWNHLGDQHDRGRLWGTPQGECCRSWSHFDSSYLESGKKDQSIRHDLRPP